MNQSQEPDTLSVNRSVVSDNSEKMLNTFQQSPWKNTSESGSWKATTFSKYMRSPYYVLCSENTKDDFPRRKEKFPSSRNLRQERLHELEVFTSEQEVQEH